jgi:hypothetical protein
VTDWALPAAIGGIVLSGVFAWFWLAEDIEAFRESSRPFQPSDDITPWGDVPRVPGGFHSTDIVEGAQRDHV